MLPIASPTATTTMSPALTAAVVVIVIVVTLLPPLLSGEFRASPIGVMVAAPAPTELRSHAEVARRTALVVMEALGAAVDVAA